jgi:hypothetical protein
MSNERGMLRGIEKERQEEDIKGRRNEGAQREKEQKIYVIVAGICTILHFHGFMLSEHAQRHWNDEIAASPNEYFSSYCNFMVGTFISVEDGRLRSRRFSSILVIIIVVEMYTGIHPL